MTNYAIFDGETSIKNRGLGAIGKHQASSYHTENRMLYLGIREKDCPYQMFRDRGPDTWEAMEDYASRVDLLVGANIKFDLLYLMRDFPAWRSWVATGSLWDVQLAEYLLTAQKHQWASLDELSEKYGGTIKDDRLKEFWKNGVDTEDIPKEIVLPYLESDVINTEIVFKAQIQECIRRGILPLVRTQMEALLATTEMEFNGMRFDKVQCLHDSLDILNRMEYLKKILHNPMELSGIQDPNCGSVDQVSAFLFGGVLKNKVQKPILGEDGLPVHFKTGARKGEIRYRLEEEKIEIVPKATPLPSWAAKKLGFYKVNDKILNEVLLSNVNTGAASWIKTLLEYRSIAKDYKTYYIGYSDLVWPSGFIHPNFNHCVTNTGRLSHSAPNLGNVSHKKDD